MSRNRNITVNRNTDAEIFDYYSTLVLPDTIGSRFPLGIRPFVAQFLLPPPGPGIGGYSDSHANNPRTGAPPLPVGGAAGTENDSTYVSPTPAAGTPFCTIELPPRPQAGDEYTISDPFGQLAGGTTLVVSGNGNFIADGGPAAPIQTYTAAVTCRRFVFTDLVQSGGAINVGTWLVVDR